MSAWLSFIGGYAKGANEQIDEQRKKEDQYIQDRMKMAAATRLEKQKEAEKRRQELKEADTSLSINEDYKTAPTAVKMAMLSSPELREIYTTKKKADPATTVMDVVNTSPQLEELAKTHKTAADYINSFQAKPKTVAPETMEAFKNPKRAFGARVGSGEEELRQNAARFGMSPEDAIGWESGGQELPSTNLGATVKKSALKPTDIDGRLKQSEAAILVATDMSNSTDPATKAKGDAALEGLMKEHLQYKTMQKTLDGTDPKTVKHILDDLVIRARGEVNAKKKKAIESEIVELKRLMNLGERVPGEGKDKEPKFGELMRTASGAKAAEQRAEMGANAAYNTGKPVFDQTPEGPALKFNSAIDKSLQDKIENVGKRGVLRVIREHTDSEGRVTSMAARNVLLSNGIDPEYFVKERQSQADTQPTSYPPAANAPRKAEQILPAAKPKTITRAEIKARAIKFGVSEADAEADAKSLGYVIK
jgi:hypothetical protein